jgi:hypothetical protein
MTTAVIANGAYGLYDLAHRGWAAVTGDQERDAIKQRLDRGDWLPPKDVVKLLRVSRTKVNNMFTDGTLPYRTLPGSRYRIADPARVRELLADAERVRSGKPDSDAAADPGNA